ncbi:MAG: hypothetical protein AB8E15_13645 [Bdellovibrionales bacterium]
MHQDSLFNSKTTSFKDDQLSKEELSFQVASLERQLLSLKSLNQTLTKTLNHLQQEKLDDIDRVEINLNQEAFHSAEERQDQNIFGARYKSKNDKVEDIQIPATAVPDHVFTDDKVDVYFDKEGDCKLCSIDLAKEHVAEEIITRKLILSKERALKGICSCCDKAIEQRVIEKHQEAELYYRSDKLKDGSNRA